MTPWEDAIEATTADFIEQLEQRGFLADGRHLNGELQVGSSAVGIQIEIPDSFPFVPPVVWPPSDLPRSWHRELTGAMCLYSADGRENLPWLDPDDFLAASARWLRESFTGWTDDFPDLDLERYFTRVDEPLVTYGELDGLSSQFVQLRREKNCTRMLGAGSLPRRAKGITKGRAFGYVAAIGEAGGAANDVGRDKADASRARRACHRDGRQRRAPQLSHCSILPRWRRRGRSAPHMAGKVRSYPTGRSPECL